MIVIPERNEHDLYFRMSDIAAFNKLLYALKELNVVLRMNFTPEGLYISELAANRNILLFVSFKASNFREYRCKGPGFIALKCDCLYRVLQNHHQRDEMVFHYKCSSKKQREEVSIEILKDEALMQECRYTLPVYEAHDKEMYESGIEEVDLMAIIDMKTFHHFVSSIKDIEIGSGYGGTGDLSLYVSDEEVTLEKNAGAFLTRCRLSLRTAKGKANKRDLTKRSIPANTVKKTFYMKHLAEVFKFFDISTSDATMLIYIKADPPTFPVIFEISIGAVGLLRIAFSPCQE